jgi:hypothetical protein
MNEEKILIYAVIAACVIGVVVVGYFALTTERREGGFSELYFSEHDELPSTMMAGEEYTIPFTVVSHEKESMKYRYNVTFDSQVIDKGEFTLSPGKERSIFIEFTPQEPTWNLTSHVTKESTSTFHKPEVLLVKESAGGDVGVFRGQFPEMLDALSKENTIVPLNIEGEYSSDFESSDIKVGEEVYSKRVSSIDVGRDEISMERLTLERRCRNETVSFTSREWKNTIRVPFEAPVVEEEAYTDEYIRMSVEPVVAKEGDELRVEMEIYAPVDLYEVVPTLEVTSWDTAFAELVSGPDPRGVDIPKGSSEAFTWTYRIHTGLLGGSLSFLGKAAGRERYRPAAFNASRNVTVLPPLGWLLLKEKEGEDVVIYGGNPLSFDKGLPGDLLLRVPLHESSSITYEFSDLGESKKVYLKKKTEISPHDHSVSIRRSIEEKVYSIEKAKLEITVESASGEVYEIHFWTSVMEPSS